MRPKRLFETRNTPSLSPGEPAEQVTEPEDGFPDGRAPVGNLSLDSVEVILDAPHTVSAFRASSPDEARVPSTLPCVPGLDLAAGAMLRPPSGDDCGGGGFLDVSQLNGGFILSIGAVKGTGRLAAALGKIAKFTLQAEALRDPGGFDANRCGAGAVDDTMRVAGTLLTQTLRRQAELSLLFGYYEPVERCLTFCNCSRWPPAVIRNGEVMLLEQRQPQMGQQWHRQYPPVQLVLSPGDVFLAFSDGLPEARRGRGMMGVGPVWRVLQEHLDDSAGELIQHLLDLTRSFCGESPPAQDTLVLAARAVDHMPEPPVR